MDPIFLFSTPAFVTIRQLLHYLGVDLVKQGEQEGVEVPQEEGEDAAQLPLEGDARMVILQLGDGLKQRGTHQAQQRHDDLQLMVKCSE